MMRVGRIQFLLGALLGLVFLVGSGAQAEEPPELKPETVLATVNGVEVRLRDLIPELRMREFGHLSGSDRSQVLKSAVKNAVDQEVLVQEARKLELGKSPELAAAARVRDNRSGQRRIFRLARIVTARDDDYRSAREKAAAAVTPALIDDYYAVNKAMYGGSPPGQAKLAVKKELSEAAMRVARATWLAQIADRIPIAVNEQPVSAERMAEEFARGSSHTGQNQFWELLHQMAGLEPLAVATAGARLGQAALNDYRDDVFKIHLQIGATELFLGDLSRLHNYFEVLVDGPDQSSSPGMSFQPQQLLGLVEKYMLAEEARRLGMDAALEDQQQPHSVQAERLLLTQMLLQQNRAGSPDDATVSAAEIAAYHEKHADQLKLLAGTSIGKEQIDSIVRRRLLAEKQEQVPQAFIDQLRAKADIKIHQQF